MVQEGRGHAAIDVWAIGEAALWSVSLFGSGRRSSFAFRATPCRRSLAGSGGWHRQSPESCGATPPPEAAASIIVRRQRSGTPSALLAGGELTGVWARTRLMRRCAN